MKDTKPVSHLNKGENFVSPSGLVWTVKEVRSIGRGRTEIAATYGKNNLSFVFHTEQVVEVVKA